MALALLDVLPEAPALDCRILATDISEPMLARARAGTYPGPALAAAPARGDASAGSSPAGPAGDAARVARAGCRW